MEEGEEGKEELVINVSIQSVCLRSPKKVRIGPNVRYHDVDVDLVGKKSAIIFFKDMKQNTIIR